MELKFQTKVNSSFESVCRKINKDLFEELIPFFSPLKVNKFEGIRVGDQYEIGLKLPIVKGIWLGEIVESSKTDRELIFVDEGIDLPVPFVKWRHTHKFISSPSKNTYLIDEIDFESYHKALDYYLATWLTGYFAYRQVKYKRVFK